MPESNLGLIGCGVMGQNLALNFERNGFSVCVYDTDAAKVAAFLRDQAAGKKIAAAPNLATLVQGLARPRRILMMVPAGRPVDACIDQLLPHLSSEDILIDGGNSHFLDSQRRATMLESKGLAFVGAGVSGGEEGALHGPSLMPGGSPAAWPHVRPMLESIAAKATDGRPCCAWIGPGGAGHFVKMVHNGIEYGDMQLIGEAYHLMRVGLKLSADQMSAVFDEWNRGELESYLIEITRDVLAFRDERGDVLVDQILDAAEQKGTGKWASQIALDLGQPLTLITEAVFARCLSALKDERVAAAHQLAGPPEKTSEPSTFLTSLRHALYAAKITSYAQGFQLMRAAASEYGWKLNFADIAAIWRAGCIIRARLLGEIADAFQTNPNLASLLLAPAFTAAISEAQAGWRGTIATAVNLGVPVPALSAALAYYDGYRCERLPANLLQAQRDYFGAHQYERLDHPRGVHFHTHWT